MFLCFLGGGGWFVGLFDDDARRATSRGIAPVERRPPTVTRDVATDTGRAWEPEPHPVARETVASTTTERGVGRNERDDQKEPQTGVRRPCAHRELLLLVEDLEHVVRVGLADLFQLVGAVEPPVVLELGVALGRADLKLGRRERSRAWVAVTPRWEERLVTAASSRGSIRPHLREDAVVERLRVEHPAELLNRRPHVGRLLEVRQEVDAELRSQTREMTTTTRASHTSARVACACSLFHAC